MIYQFNGHEPEVGNNCFVAQSADVMGRVKLSDHASIWFNVVARGDIELISIGGGSNVQDLSMLHTTHGFPLSIGSYVTVGHSVTLHSCTIGDRCLIGMGVTILDGAVIGENSLVAAGSTVPPGKKYPPGSFIVGSPAKAIRNLSDEEKEGYGNHYKSYIEAKDAFLKEGMLVPIS